MNSKQEVLLIRGLFFLTLKIKRENIYSEIETESNNSGLILSNEKKKIPDRIEKSIYLLILL